MLINNKAKRNTFIGAFFVNISFICVSFLNFQLTVSASCVFTDGRLGECIKFRECRSAVILSQKGVNPGFCSLEEGTVCCTDYRGIAQAGRQPFSEVQSSRPQKWSSQLPNVEDFNLKGTVDLNIQKKKPSAGVNNSGTSRGKKKNSDIIEEPHKFETSNTFYSESGITNKPVRQPSRPKHDQDDDGYFAPPGLAKKKWREEKTTENDYYYEQVTKKPNRGPCRKSSNKHTGNNNDSNNSRKRGDTNITRRPEWPTQGGKKMTSDWYSGQNEYESDYFNQRTTPKNNNLGQETYITTERPDFFGGGSGHNYAESGNEYSNIVPPARRPQRPSFSYSNANRPNFQGPPNQESTLTNQQGLNSHPPNQQGFDFSNNSPNSRPGFQKRRISEQKCEEYSKQVTENITGLPLTTNPDPVTISVRKCITPQQLIVGGENTTVGEFPHMAAIGFRDRNKKQIAWNCGGSLISDYYVMTAAHCTSTTLGRPVKVRLGEYNLMKNDDGAYPVDYGVAEIITHPEYKPPSKYNDIALLKLTRKVTFFKHIRPACLYSQETFSASKAIATGWGRMHFEGGSSEILQKVVLSIVDNNTCNRLYKINVKTELLSRGIIDSQICAGELTGGKDTCQGDSGGPLSITSTKCIHHVIGITSFGKSCALPNSTGVYTRVSAYVPWIESIVWPISYK